MSLAVVTTPESHSLIRTEPYFLIVYRSEVCHHHLATDQHHMASSFQDVGERRGPYLGHAIPTTVGKKQEKMCNGS